MFIKEKLKVKKSYIFLFILSCLTLNLLAQLKVGSNPKALKTNAIFEIEATSGKSAIFTKDSAFLGLGTLTPSRNLDIQNNTPGAIKIVDGTQGLGKVLTSDANGVAVWATPFSLTPENLTNSNGIIVTGGIGATLTATSLRIDSTAIAKMVNQSPVKDSVIKTVAINMTSSPLKESAFNAIQDKVDTSNDYWRNNGTSTFTSIGNVGIGTNNPISRLSNTSSQIVGSSYGSSSLGLQWTINDGGFASAYQNLSSTGGGLLLKVAGTGFNGHALQLMNGLETKFLIRNNGYMEVNGNQHTLSNTNLVVNGSIGHRLVSVNSNYTILDNDYFVVSNASSATTLTLPDPANYSGRVVKIINKGSGLITITSVTANKLFTAGSPKTSILFSSSNVCFPFVSDGTHWIRLSEN